MNNLMSDPRRKVVTTRSARGHRMGYTADEYEDMTARNIGAGMHDDGLTVAQVYEHARRTGTRVISWLPTETASV